MSVTATIRNLGAFCSSGRWPSARAAAVIAKLNGYRLERRWPFLIKSDAARLNFGYEDALEFQYARTRTFRVLVVGAYDGVANDALGRFLTTRDCCGVLVEPQPDVFARLKRNFESHKGLQLVNAAIDRCSGTRELFQVPAGIPSLPQWTEQLASFRREHIEKHEDRAPGVSARIVSTPVRTVSFSDLLDEFEIRSIDVLQIDAEGFDAVLLSWFPFERVKPGVVHYETAHMTPDELHSTRQALKAHGYRLYPTESTLDEMAILI
jgi:FkbM family methyltransferase